ncbi:MAG: MBOAT family protein [Bacteroidales bacterium]|nr:MBOAT family protein [Bacteroidales bacterium]
MEALRTFLTNLFAFDQAHPLLFTQFNFWAFFLIVYALFCVIVGRGRHMSKSRRLVRNGYLALVSLFFYYKTSGLFVLLLVFSTLFGYAVGKRMDHLHDLHPDGTAQRRRKAWMVTGVVVNLLVLCYFKYAYFFTDIYNTLFHSDLQVVNYLALWANHFSDTPRFDASQILLPVGISFFTFQNISYVVDVYRRQVAHADNVLDFGFYTTFFPQLVAGPIVRADQFVPQLYRPYFLSRRQFGIALFWVLNGLVKKIVLSDYLAINFVDRVFDNPLLFTPFENLSALLIYSLQVYADFSGYTDIAIGVAMMMGFYLPKNFNSPYKAATPAEFWRRWHISLSHWLRDYLYIPLGGNRNATPMTFVILSVILIFAALLARTTWVTLVVTSLLGLLLAAYLLLPRFRKDIATNVNNMDTMLLGGMWHGASFNFITWGALNGVGILVSKMWRRRTPWQRVVIGTVLFVTLILVRQRHDGALLSLATVWSGVVCFGTAVRYLLLVLRHEQPMEWLDRSWNVLLTFFFISFTRLFFRSGSNLHPAEANEVAWRTAQDMVRQIGGTWHLEHIPAIVANYAPVFVLFVIGMVIHWLPERFKRRYRLWFASLPLWLMVVVAAAVVFGVYQFVSADLQPFIYFQF